MKKERLKNLKKKNLEKEMKKERQIDLNKKELKQERN